MSISGIPNLANIALKCAISVELFISFSRTTSKNLE